MAEYKYAESKPLGFYIDKINNKEPFSLVRYGDGEFKNMYETPVKINKEMDYFEQAKKDLLETIEKPIIADNYFYALQNLAVRTYGNKIDIPEFMYNHNCDVFHRASINGELFPFIEVLRRKRIVIVGAKYLGALKEIIPYIRKIEIPEHNCYLQKDFIVDSIKKYASRKRNIIYLFAASIATNIMIYELYKHIKNCWLIDIGSVFDPYVGNQTRGYQKRLDDKTLLNKNLGVFNEQTAKTT